MQGNNSRVKKIHPQKTTMKIGNKIQMTAENSNWVVGEIGTIIEILEGEKKVVIAFEGREDDYTVFVGDFEIIGSSVHQVPNLKKP
jgi:hypothetical protein